MCFYQYLLLLQFLEAVGIFWSPGRPYPNLAENTVVSYQNRPRVDGLVPKSDIHQGSAEFHMH